MPKFPFDPPTLGRKDLPAVLWISISTLAINAVVAEFMRERFMQNVPFWSAYIWWNLTIAVGFHFYYLIFRPLRGQPPLFRKRPGDDFETWLLGSGFKWSRLTERYTTDELLLVFGFQAVLLFATLFYSVRM